MGASDRDASGFPALKLLNLFRCGTWDLPAPAYFVASYQEKAQLSVAQQAEFLGMAPEEARRPALGKRSACPALAQLGELFSSHWGEKS